MPGGRNHCGCKRRFLCACFITEIFFTNTAIPVFCISCFCTGSCFAIRLIQLMSCWNCCISKQYFLSSFVITKILSANRTIPVLYVSCFCTGCCFAFCLTQLMPGGRNHCGCKRRFLCACFITEIFFANTAIPVFRISRFCAGSCFSIPLA